MLCLDWPHAISALILVVYGLHITFLFLKWARYGIRQVEKCQHEITCHLLIRSPAASRAAEKRGAARLGCTPPRRHATTPPHHSEPFCHVLHIPLPPLSSFFTSTIGESTRTQGYYQAAVITFVSLVITTFIFPSVSLSVFFQQTIKINNRQSPLFIF